jgi:hypothetical protein
MFVASFTPPSATQLANWLGAESYFTSYRPVPLNQYLISGNEAFSFESSGGRGRQTSSQTVIGLPHPPLPPNSQPEALQRFQLHQVSLLCQERVSRGLSVLIFCPTRNYCANTALEVSKHLADTVSPALTAAEIAARDALLVKLQLATSHSHWQSGLVLVPKEGSTITNPKKALNDMLRAGVAFHHSNLNMDERRLVEEAFRTGTLKVLVATSTLAAGVNLPASCVVFRQFYIRNESKLLTPVQYQQMSGRAGRKGMGELGESVAFCSTNPPQVRAVMDCIESPLGALRSHLLQTSNDNDEHMDNVRGFRRLCLDAINILPSRTIADVQKFFQLTFMASITSSTQWVPVFHAALTYLRDRDFIRMIVPPPESAAAAASVATGHQTLSVPMPVLPTFAPTHSLLAQFAAVPTGSPSPIAAPAGATTAVTAVASPVLPSAAMPWSASMTFNHGVATGRSAASTPVSVPFTASHPSATAAPVFRPSVPVISNVFSSRPSSESRPRVIAPPLRPTTTPPPPVHLLPAHTAITITKLGEASFFSGHDTEEASLCFDVLSAMRKTLFLPAKGLPLHLCYLCVPMHSLDIMRQELRWEQFEQDLQRSTECTDQALAKALNISVDSAAWAERRFTDVVCVYVCVCVCVCVCVHVCVCLSVCLC